MGVGSAVKQIWDRVTGLDAAQEEGARKTVAAPLVGSIFAPVRGGSAVNYAAEADCGESAAVCGDAGSEACDQLHQEPDRVHGVADRDAA